MKKIIILLIIFGVLVITSFALIGYSPKPKAEVSDAQQKEIERLKNEIDALKENKNTNETPVSKPAPVVKEETGKETTTLPVPPKKAVLSDLGDFKIFYGPTQNAHYEGLNQLIRNSGVFENIANFLNVILILQKDFPITFKECGFVNAYYTLEGKEIVVCDELVENFAQNFAYFIKSESELDKAVTDATLFILFHELGHGLIDIYDLTYSGKEEDVVDQLSTIVLVNSGEDGARAAITGANLFYITSSQIDAGSYPFWDEHSLNQQRYYNILCWVYGSNPQKYNDFVGVYGLPEERAVRCQREYEKMSEFWDVAIDPYVKEEIKNLIE
ncbi:MAG: DUF4344 domain-containing metallopeptidase [Candidatus Pacebacteria bacterium]|nr:DUF4344 domain-containing metallopeptidase [Candidatus Paceibacterota bacterium]